MAALSGGPGDLGGLTARRRNTSGIIDAGGQHQVPGSRAENPRVASPDRESDDMPPATAVRPRQLIDGPSFTMYRHRRPPHDRRGQRQTSGRQRSCKRARRIGGELVGAQR
jgi:hypothetical protein